MALTSFAATSISHLKLMENYAIVSAQQITTPSQNIARYDLLTSDLLKKIDDLASTFQVGALSAQDLSSAAATGLKKSFVALMKESALFYEPPDEIVLIFRGFSDHLQELVRRTEKAVEKLDYQAARAYHESKLAFDIDKFRLEKILGDMRERICGIKRCSPSGGTRNAEADGQIAAVKVKAMRQTAHLLRQLQDAVFSAVSALHYLDAAAKMFLDVSCDVCGRRNSCTNLPLVLAPCGHGMCQTCAQEAYGVLVKRAESLQNAQCRVCGQDAHAACLDQAMARRVVEKQLDSSELVCSTLQALEECQKIAAAYEEI